MNRFSLLTAAVAVALFAGAARADDPPSAGGKGKDKGKRPDPEQTFKKLDENGDGKLTPEEFKKFGEMMREKVKDKLQDKPEAAERLFKRLDENGDGTLSLEEFKKMGEMRRDRKPGGGKPEGGEKPKPPTA